MKQTIITLVAVLLSTLAVSVRAAEPQPYEKNGWGITTLGEFRSEKTTEWDWASGLYPDGFIKHHDSNFYQVKYNTEKDYTIGALVFYNWHPLKNHKSDIAKHFFVRPGFGGGYNKYGYNKQFMFTAQALVGYTWRVKQIGLDVFTGPTAKFGAKVFSYKGPYGDELETVPVSELPVVHYKMYSAGAAWSFGIGINYRYVGATLSYNQPMTKNFEHYWSPDHSIKSFPRNPMHKTLTIGLLYYF